MVDFRHNLNTFNFVYWIHGFSNAYIQTSANGKPDFYRAIVLLLLKAFNLAWRLNFKLQNIVV